jgi:hypothetical protein
MWHRDIYWFGRKIEISIINILNTTAHGTFLGILYYWLEGDYSWFKYVARIQYMIFAYNMNQQYALFSINLFQ